jgi:hypothetical protein
MAYSDPVRTALAVTPSDSVDIRTGQLTRGIYVGGTGDMSVVMDNGTVAFVGVVAGAVYPIRVSRVNATGTTATNILALY